MIAPVLKFNGDCAEAIELYKKAFGATDEYVDYYRNAPDDSGLPNKGPMADKIMHSGMTIAGTHFNMSDEIELVENGNRYAFNVFLDSDDKVKAAFEILKEGGNVVVNLGPQFFSPMYASVLDRFGVHWQLIADYNNGE